MRLEPASEATKQILDGIRKQIANGQTIHLKKNASGWQYGGKEFNENVESLRQQMQQELGNQGFNVKSSIFPVQELAADHSCRWLAVPFDISSRVQTY